MKRYYILSLLLLIFAQVVVADVFVDENQAPLPYASSNNAVTAFRDSRGLHLFSLLGLGQKKTVNAIHKRGYTRAANGNWQQIDVPGPPRLAAAAVSVGQSIYLIGGYTVAADGSETSTADAYRYQTGTWERLNPMPVPVDDMVALVYQQRYIYLVSGWHDVGNVNLVQVLDTRTNQWVQATPWPGTPVFGHAGAIFENTMLVCDGVQIQYPQVHQEKTQKREFLNSTECWLGEVQQEDYRRIHWRSIKNHPGEARYRMVATATDAGLIVFVGGSTNPYNYNGIGYDKKKSTAESGVFSFDLSSEQWSERGTLPEASMDHRGLVYDQGWFYLVGGMLDPQIVSDRVYKFKLK